MDKKTLYMIGNSHIDPVWFWDWDEGMQEVKATFSSALDRLEEFPEMKFTATSSAFFEWIEIINPEMFDKIKKYVEDGRFELTGGWYIEPDCHLPTGEAFVRQGLYAQRFFKSRFGKIAKIGSNVDSFGHSVGLPQILKKSGMDYYVSMRTKSKENLFNWESESGDNIVTLSLPSEYTTWFYESTKAGMENTLKAINEYHGLPCCYGVGNHGGGPTIANINAVVELRKEFENVDIKFSTYGEFFDKMIEEDELKQLPVISENFEKINVGCYSIDGEYKKMNRLTESRLFIAESMLAIEKIYTGKVSTNKNELERLWKILLFNQFHDTLGGTAVKAARNEAMMQLAGVNAECKKIWTIAMQNIINFTKTEGEGFPLFVFNPTCVDYDAPMQIELNWFCKDELQILDSDGNEIEYQRVHTEAKVRNYNLGGRRGVAFNAKIPAFGFAVYRTVIKEPTKCFDARSTNLGSPYIMENDFVKVKFDVKSGQICSLIEKETGYEALSKSLSWDIWVDQRDSWGGLQGRPFYDMQKTFELVSLETVEDGSIRKVVRGVYRYEDNEITQIYTLYKSSSEVIIDNFVQWNKKWHMLKYRMPINVERFESQSEGSYTMLNRDIEDGDEYYAHRFIDVSNDGKGLVVANDSKYGFSVESNDLLITILRSCMYSQGNGRKWYEPLEHYKYTDIGEQNFSFILRPHGNKMNGKEKFGLAYQVNKMNLYIADNIHSGEREEVEFNGISINADNVIISSIKEAEDDNDLIVRLLEVDGVSVDGYVEINNKKYAFKINKYELITLKINLETGSVVVVNLIEEE